MEVDILALAAHPDDVELSCAGTLLRQKDLGYSFGIVDMTRGELGTRGTPEIREQEASAALDILGGSFRINLGMADGFFRYNDDNLKAIIREIRLARPKVVLINAPEDRHPDHGRAAKLCADAAYFSGLAKIETLDEDGQPQERWRPQAVYHYIQDYNLKADFVVDITDYMEQKMAAIRAFSSQFPVPEAAARYQGELDTPLSRTDFLDYMIGKARSYGRPAGYEFGEGFIVARTMGVPDLMALD